MHTSKRKKETHVTYKTYREDAVLIAFFLFVGVGVFGFLTTFDFLGVPKEDASVRSFLAEQYNFTENECVSSHVEYQLCVKEAMCTPLFNSSGDLYHFRTTVCSLYCRTIQIPDGQDCKTINKQFIEICFRVFRADTNETLDEGCASDYYVTLHQDIIPALGFYRQNTPKVIYETWEVVRSTYDETICTPIYKNITTFCATAEQIATARGLIR